MNRLLPLTIALGAAQLVHAEGFALGLIPDGPQPAALVARQDAQCASSVQNEVLAPTPASPDLSDWVLNEGQNAATCSVAAPASLSSEYTSWMAQVTDWAKDVKDEAKKLPKCGYDTFTISFTGFCDSSRTVFYTDEFGEAVSTGTYGPVPVPSGVHIGSAPRNTGVLGMGLALAAIVAVAVAL